MEDRRAAELLREREDEGNALLNGAVYDGLSEWQSRTAATLRATLAPGNPLIDEFAAVKYHPTVWTSGTDFRPYRARGVKNALGIVRTAIYEIEELTGSAVGTNSGYDEELWSHVAEVVVAGRWETVASQAAIWLEDRLRKWSGRAETEYGTKLVSNVLRPSDGDFPLGRTEGERQGWMQFGLGIVGAVSNSVRHRIDERTDPKRYALGVLGAVSLLLTELKNTYPDRCTASTQAPGFGVGDG